jgi:small subunit ribosomal protein S9
MPTIKEKTKKAEKYYQATGRRKTSSCTVRLYEKKKGEIVINDKKIEDYFRTPELVKTVKAPLTYLELDNNFYISVKVFGGGVKSQAEAVRHGIARALVVFNEELRKKMKSTGYLTRDPRMRERKKPGLTRARRAPQWRKR